MTTSIAVLTCLGRWRAGLAIAVLLAACGAHAHDIPGESRIHAFIKSEGEHLRVLVRVPLALLLNLNLPKRGVGYLDLPAVRPLLPRAIAATTADLEFFEDGRRLELSRGEARIALPSDKTFESFDQALAAIRGPPLDASTDVFWNQGYFDAYLTYPIRSAQSGFAIDFHVSPGLGDRLKLDLRWVLADGTIRAYELPTGQGMMLLDPRWYQAALSFTQSGFTHILSGIDHLLFLLCLVIPFRRVGWPLVAVITAFTIAHSVTLIAAAYGFAPGGTWFPPMVETLIAASILYMAIENVLQPNLGRRWLVTGLFGLVHGFAFSFLLQSQLQFAGAHLALSLLAFNIGIELGQLLVLLMAAPLLVWLARSHHQRVIGIIVSALVAHTAWHWTSDRFDALRKVNWPAAPELAPAAVVATLVFIAAIGALIRFARTSRA
ncbi:MAG: HupE/UreJ family protein [Burkholderiales bacterium]